MGARLQMRDLPDLCRKDDVVVAVVGCAVSTSRW
jgi:hypothetical protein